MAKKFEFKLKTLLKLRKFEERQAKEAVGAILKEIDEINVSIKEMKKNIDGVYSSEKKSTDTRMLSFFPKHIQAIKADISSQTVILDALKRKYEEAKTVLAKSRGEVRVVENIKDKKFKEHKKKNDKNEQEMLEEIISQRHAQNRL